jgi:hypothetical protein
MLMGQTAVLCGFYFDALSLGQHGFATTKIDVSRSQVADPLVVAVVVVVIDECGDGGFKFPVEEVVFEQDAVLQGLVQALDLFLRLGMHGRAANMYHTFVFEVFRQVVSAVRRAIIADQARFVKKLGTVAA